jgi:hypothetical protein
VRNRDNLRICDKRESEIRKRKLGLSEFRQKRTVRLRGRSIFMSSIWRISGGISKYQNLNESKRS